MSEGDLNRRLDALDAKLSAMVERREEMHIENKLRVAHLSEQIDDIRVALWGDPSDVAEKPGLLRDMNTAKIIWRSIKRSIWILAGAWLVTKVPAVSGWLARVFSS